MVCSVVFRRFFTANRDKKADDDSFVNFRDQGQLFSGQTVRRGGYQVLCLLIGDRTAHDFVH
jgi:hypothetical protein